MAWQKQKKRAHALVEFTFGLENRYGSPIRRRRYFARRRNVGQGRCVGGRVNDSTRLSCSADARAGFRQLGPAFVHGH